MKPDPHRTTDLYLDTVMLGSSVEAMIAAYMYELPIFGNIENKPMPYYHISPCIDLSPIKVDNKIIEYINEANRKEERGIQRIELWNTMMHRLSIMGLAPFFGMYHGYIPKLVDIENNIINLVVNHRKVKIHVKNKIILFDHQRYENGKGVYLVNDYIKLHNVYDGDTTIFISDDCDFLDTVAFETIFFKRDKRMHNCCVKSIIDEVDLNHWNKSPTAVRMKTERTIFWEMEKDIKISLIKREKKPMLAKYTECLEDLIHHDIFDGELYG